VSGLAQPFRLRLDDELAERLRRRAELEDRSAAQIVRRAIRRELALPIATVRERRP
jgi:predicted transcriptional regulator